MTNVPSQSITAQALSKVWSALRTALHAMMENDYYARQLNTLSTRTDADLRASGTSRQQELARIIHVVA